MVFRNQIDLQLDTGPLRCLLLFRAFLAAMLLFAVALERASAEQVRHHKGYNVTATGLTPEYPSGYACSPLTSLYASWIDVDGSRRNERHTGVDGGRLGEWILAPAAGRVRAVWRSNWGWGWEGSLLIVHTRGDLGLEKGPMLYYSALDHLSYDEIKSFKVGQPIERGQRLGTVQRPGGNSNYLPEVHWEVWEATTDQLRWRTNQHGGGTWSNTTARLIDPLSMLRITSRSSGPSKNVKINPFVSCQDQTACHGFTYILPCKPRGAGKHN